jgi:hypothetical protein
MARRGALHVLGTAALLGLAGCGSSTTAGVGDSGTGDGTGVDPCIANFDPNCGETCTYDTDCGASLHCKPGGICGAECIMGGAECGAGRHCGAHGWCQDDACPSVTVGLAPVVPTVVLLIDQSGSMSESFGGRSRWEAVRVALTDPTSGVVPALQSKVIFGASLYTSHNGTLDGENCPLLQVVPPALNNSAPIRDLLRDHQPDGDTPTGESIDAVVATFGTSSPDPDNRQSPRVIVLATDGEPDTCAVPNPQTGQALALEGAGNAYAAGIRTFILSVGSEVGHAHLQDMANAGVGLPVGGTEHAPFYVANDTSQLVDAFDEIIRGVRTCVLTLSGHVAAGSEASGDVRLNGQPLGYGDPNGWRMIDDETLELVGTACTTLLESDTATLSATFPCGSIIE